jgi:hypothetical protein
MATTTLTHVYNWMHAFNRQAAPHSECVAWQDFVYDCYDRYGVAPWDDQAEEIEPSQNFVCYWLDVSNNTSSIYNADGDYKSC